MIEANHYINISEALKNVPGVTIQNYGTGGENYSSNSIYINGTSNVVFLIDGMRVNTNGIISSRFEPSTMVNMDNIERIEVLKVYEKIILDYRNLYSATFCSDYV